VLLSGLGIDVSIDCAIKVKETSELKRIFDFEQRMRILADVFEVRDPVVAGRTVLLFDDLYRSGTTLNAVTRVLLEQGKARDVYALTLTITRRMR